MKPAKTPRIFGLTLVKNESDILQQSLTSAMEWCDKIGVLDNHSSDSTVEIVRDLERNHPGRIVLLGTEPREFHDSFRSRIFHHFLPEARPGDWWCRLDGDEIYVDDPREFLQTRVRPWEHNVWGVQISYYYTTEEYNLWKQGRETVADRERPIGERRRFYKADNAETRFLRHRNGIRWPIDSGFSWPHPMGPVASECIRIKHFKWRDPLQIQSRAAVRAEAFRQGHHNWGWMDPAAVLEKIAPASDLHCDRHDGNYEIDWKELPDHRQRTLRVRAKNLAHRIGILP